MHTKESLKQKQALPLDQKVQLTKQRIQEWVDRWGLDGVCVSFSGGKDSTVLLHIAREMYPDIKAVFIDTGLEYPELREFVRTFDNVDWIKPQMSFKQTIQKYGYPFISKEVAECVYGARKYLKRLIDEGIIKQDIYNIKHEDNEQMFWGGGYNATRLEEEHLKSLESGKHHYYQSETSKLLGTGKYSRPEQVFTGGVRQQVS